MDPRHPIQRGFAPRGVTADSHGTPNHITTSTASPTPTGNLAQSLGFTTSEPSAADRQTWMRRLDPDACSLPPRLAALVSLIEAFKRRIALLNTRVRELDETVQQRVMGLTSGREEASQQNLGWLCRDSTLAKMTRCYVQSLEWYVKEFEGLRGVSLERPVEYRRRYRAFVVDMVDAKML